MENTIPDPCPFCGAMFDVKRGVWYSGGMGMDGGYSQICCLRCGARGPEVPDTDEDGYGIAGDKLRDMAARKWNIRARNLSSLTEWIDGRSMQPIEMPQDFISQKDAFAAGIEATLQELKRWLNRKVSK